METATSRATRRTTTVSRWTETRIRMAASMPRDKQRRNRPFLEEGLCYSKRKNNQHLLIPINISQLIFHACLQMHRKMYSRFAFSPVPLIGKSHSAKYYNWTRESTLRRKGSNKCTRNRISEFSFMLFAFTDVSLPLWYQIRLQIFAS